MGNEIVKAAGNLPAKSDLATYVHDVAELETAIFTLDKTVEESRAMRVEKRKTLETEISETENKRERARRDLEQKEKKDPRQNPPKEDKIFVAGIITSFVVGFFFALIFSLVIGEENPEDVVWRTFFGGWAIFLSIGVLIDLGRRCDSHRTYVKECEAHKKKVEVFDGEIAVLKTNFQEAEEVCLAAVKALEAHDAAEPIFEASIAEFAPKRAALVERLEALYAYGLIAPDYRKMDCALDLDYIFRNDLCDTMREALLLYDERVFRGAVLVGIDRIYDMLGSLAATMRHMESTLETVRHHVSLMSEDLCELVSDSRANLRKQEKILEESRMNRYAAERLAASNERLEYYARKWDTK